MRATDDELEILEENILEMSNEDTTLPNICLEDLEVILTRFFGRKISLSL
jgi:hypothetical protein